MIRTRQTKAGTELARGVIEKFEQEKLIFEAASARLAVALAMLAGDDPSSALQIAREALDFFEPRRIWEAVWRGHLAMARASRISADAESHKSAARAALDQLGTLWPPQTVDAYLRRPDVRLLSGGIQF
jgi:hypothetical protein